MEKINYPKYNDPIQMIWRKGDFSDPYLPINEEITVINSRCVTSEIPDEFTRVTISGMNELFKDIFGNLPPIKVNDYHVDYSSGIITFHKSKESSRMNVAYKGRGYILYPAERIWVHAPNPYGVENLQEFIELAIQRIADVNDAIARSNKATNESIAATNESIEATEHSIETTEVSIQKIKDMKNSIEEVDWYTLMAEETTKDAEVIYNLLVQDRDRTRLDWKEAVEDYPDLMVKYPQPEIGWAVMTKDNGNFYRWDGNFWILIGNMKGSIPTANDMTDGLFTKEQFTKLEGIEEKAEVNFVGEDAKTALPDYFRIKTMVFVFPYEIETGTQEVMLQFPHDGKIEEIRTFCGVPGADYSEIQVDKISSQDFIDDVDWSNMFALGKNIVLGYSERVDDKSHELESNIVEKGDYFRVTVLEAGIGMSNLTIEIDIQI